MNIEELELSLRTEFEGQVRNVLAGIKNDVAEFQLKFQSELEDHRNKLDQAINDLSSRLPETSAFDAAFNESVNEHLRLARDDGAQVAATAFGEAEKLRVETAPAAAPQGFDLLRDAIADISAKKSQATILQALVGYASKFAARGAFFIVKNDHFVAWKVFGSETGDDTARDVLFPASSDTVLAASIRSMAKVSASNGAFAEDRTFLGELHFGDSAESYAIPLMARGRGVAVLYADGGTGGSVNADALETLVRVAGMTVELLAASHPVPAPQPEAVQPTASQADESGPEVSENAASFAEVHEAHAEPYSEVSADYTVASPDDAAAAVEPEPEDAEISAEPVRVQEAEFVAEYTGEVTYELEQNGAHPFEAPADEAPAVEAFEPLAEEVISETAAEPVSDYTITSGDSYDASYETVAETEVSHDIPVVEAPVAVTLNGHAEVATVAEPVVEVASAEPKKSRFSDRNVDLPIEVADEERKLHNDARRFARLLVSEIKLYNEQKVTDGRESGNLYEHLKEAIDRSREMYDKRVQPAVASKFDYFHYEVVNSLADGQDSKLGSGYPGATV